MKVMKSALVASLALISSGCVSTPKPQVTAEQVSIPELNVAAVKYLGESLVYQATGYWTESVTTTSGSTSTMGTTVDFSATKYYLTANGMWTSHKKNAVKITNSLGGWSENQDYVYIDSDRSKICNARMGHCLDVGDEISLNFKEKDFWVEGNSFQQVIEYNGKQGSVLSFTYREFSDNLARSAFTQPFTLDLNEGNTIGYKGARIIVDKATNTEISYKVISNFNNKRF